MVEDMLRPVQQQNTDLHINISILPRLHQATHVQWNGPCERTLLITHFVLDKY